MRMKITAWVLLGIVTALLLSGCSRDRLRSQGGQPSYGENNPLAAAQQGLPTTPAPLAPPARAGVGAGASVIQPAAATTVLQPTSTPAAAQPTLSQGSASSADILQASEDLTNLLKDLSRDLNDTDTLNDVK